MPNRGIQKWNTSIDAFLKEADHVQLRLIRGFIALHVVALIALLAGTVGSVGLMLYAGRHHQSRILLLLILFALWVLSPFVALSWAHLRSKRWSVVTRVALDTATVVVAFGSLALYGEVALGPTRAQTASVFVVVPPASLLLLALVLSIAWRISSKLSRGYDGD